MILYVLTKRYSDNSGFYVLGATTDCAVAQAFHAGGTDSDPHSEVYEVNDNDPVRSMGREYEALSFDDEDRQPEVVATPVAVSSDDDSDIPF